MKKILLIGTLLFSLNLFSQIATLEHTYQTYLIHPEAKNVIVTESGLKYYTYHQPNNYLSLYDSNHQFIKNIPLPPMSDFGNMIVTDKLFNSDIGLEFLLKIFDTSPQQYPSIVLIDENGVVLQDFGAKFTWAFFHYNNTYKMRLDTDPWDVSYVPYTIEIYTLSGTLSADQQFMLEKQGLLYPNPADSTINITGIIEDGQSSDIQVFNMAGQMVIEKTVTGNSAGVQLDVSNLQSGTYIYKLGGQTKKFIKN
jgi:hypothetical protein